jgi:hypothetical protein
MTKYYFATMNIEQVKKTDSFGEFAQYDLSVQGLLDAFDNSHGLIVVLVREEEWSARVVDVITANETGEFRDGTKVPKNVLAILAKGNQRARNGYWETRGRRVSGRMFHNYFAALTAAESLAAN